MLDIKCVFILVSDTDMSPCLTQFIQALWSSATLLELFINPEFFQRKFCPTMALRHLAFLAKKTKEMELHILCGQPCSLCISTFLCEQLLETKIKDMSRRALARCKIQGDKMEGKDEFKGKGKEMQLVSFHSLYSSCFLSQEVYVDFQYLKQSALGIYPHFFFFLYDGNHPVKGWSFIFADITPGSSQD